MVDIVSSEINVDTVTSLTYAKKSFAEIKNANQDILGLASMEKVLNFC